jgi:hypothetical protein
MGLSVHLAGFDRLRVLTQGIRTGALNSFWAIFVHPRILDGLVRLYVLSQSVTDVVSYD